MMAVKDGGAQLELDVTTKERTELTLDEQRSPAGATIVVVEDAAETAEFTELLLGAAGYDVHIAPTAEDGLRAARLHRPKVMLVDIQLPGMNGLDLTRIIKADPQTRDIRIIVYTAFSTKGDRDRALEAGAEVFLLKPTPAAQLLEEIAKLV